MNSCQQSFVQITALIQARHPKNSCQKHVNYIGICLEDIYIYKHIYIHTHIYIYIYDNLRFLTKCI